MSYDVTLKSAEGAELSEFNITYNLSPMLRAAGFGEWRELNGEVAHEAGLMMLSTLDAMISDPDRWRAMNPENGWGTYDECLQKRMRSFAYDCLLAPRDATLEVC